MSTKKTDSSESSENHLNDNRRGFLKKAAIGGLGLGILSTANATANNQTSAPSTTNVYDKKTPIKIIDLKCAIIGNSPVVRIVTNVGISGYGQAETAKNYLKPYVLFYKDYLMGEDPTDVERVMLKIRRLGSFKPWGSAVSAIEMALWDIAGRAAGVPVYKLLGGKIRDHVRVYNGAVRFPMEGQNPSDYAGMVAKMKASPEGFTIVKMGIGFHSKMVTSFPDFYYGSPQAPTSPAKTSAQVAAGAASYEPVAQTAETKTSAADSKTEIVTKSGPHPNRGPLTEKGFKHIIACVAAMKEVLGDEVGLALDLGPGYMLSDAIRLAKALEPYNLMWLEDMLTGDYTPYVMADMYRELTVATSVPIHTGEQIYLRQNFRELFEQKAIRVVGPDVEDVGGMAELKWIAEYADLHGIQMAPHGIFDGLIGLAAQVHVGAVMPENYIAFEYSIGNPKWWNEIIEGLPNPIVKNGVIEVWDRPGLGVDFKIDAAKKYLLPEDKNFFD